MPPWIFPGWAGNCLVATMLVEPAERAVTTPVLLIVATDGLDEVQTTSLDIFWVDPSENAPRAMNCWTVPTNVAGITFMMEDREAEVTVRVVLPEILPEVAVIVTVPTATAMARPLLLLIVATDVFDQLQET